MHLDHDVVTSPQLDSMKCFVRASFPPAGFSRDNWVTSRPLDIIENMPINFSSRYPRHQASDASGLWGISYLERVRERTIDLLIDSPHIA